MTGHTHVEPVGSHSGSRGTWKGTWRSTRECGRTSATCAWKTSRWWPASGDILRPTKNIRSTNAIFVRSRTASRNFSNFIWWSTPVRSPIHVASAVKRLGYRPTWRVTNTPIRVSGLMYVLYVTKGFGNRADWRDTLPHMAHFWTHTINLPAHLSKWGYQTLPDKS